MTTMGDLLAAARRSAGPFQSWLAESDPELARAVADAAAREGSSPAGFVRGAVADFSRLAPEEDWATLVSTIRDSADPGSACLLAMVHWRLAAPACADHDFHHSQLQGGAADERPATRPAR